MTEGVACRLYSLAAVVDEDVERQDLDRVRAEPGKSGATLVPRSHRSHRLERMPVSTAPMIRFYA